MTEQESRRRASEAVPAPNQPDVPEAATAEAFPCQTPVRKSASSSLEGQQEQPSGLSSCCRDFERVQELAPSEVHPYHPSVKETAPSLPEQLGERAGRYSLFTEQGCFVSEDIDPVWLDRIQQDAEGTFWSYLGCRLERLERGLAVISLEALPHHLNGIGMLHGGVQAALMDHTMGLAAMSARPANRVVTAQLSMNYVAPIRSGRIIATAEVVHEAGRTITVQARIFAESLTGALGSMATGAFRVLPGLFEGEADEKR